MNVPQPQTPRQAQLEGLFEEFVGMGTDRTYGKLARKHGIEAPELMRHARGFLWPERINQLSIQQNEQTRPAVDAEDDAGASQINVLHLTRLKLLQKKAMEYLENVTFDKPDSAMRLLIETMKLEREIRGLTKDKTDDLREVLLGKIKEIRDAAPASDEPDFKFDPDYIPPPLTTDGPESTSPPPSGGDHAE